MRLTKSNLCVATALERLLEIVETVGPLFRTLCGRLTANRLDPVDVARTLRRRCATAGVDAPRGYDAEARDAGIGAECELR